MARSIRNSWTPRCPEKRYLQKKHGMSQKDWWELLRAMDGCCYICGKKGRMLYVDHLHLMADAGLIRGSVRGLACYLCNRAIAQFKDDPAWMRAAADYCENPPAWSIWPDEIRETP